MGDEHVEVKVGQTWESRDSRDMGRKVEIESVDGHFVHVRSVRRSRVRLINFYKLYRFVR